MLISETKQQSFERVDHYNDNQVNGTTKVKTSKRAKTTGH